MKRQTVALPYRNVCKNPLLFRHDSAADRQNSQLAYRTDRSENRCRSAPSASSKAVGRQRTSPSNRITPAPREFSANS